MLPPPIRGHRNVQGLVRGTGTVGRRDVDGLEAAVPPSQYSAVDLNVREAQPVPQLVTAREGAVGTESGAEASAEGATRADRRAHRRGRRGRRDDSARRQLSRRHHPRRSGRHPPPRTSRPDDRPGARLDPRVERGRGARRLRPHRAIGRAHPQRRSRRAVTDADHRRRPDEQGPAGAPAEVAERGASAVAGRLVTAR
jgi:hypothetical protein